MDSTGMLAPAALGFRVRRRGQPSVSVSICRVKGFPTSDNFESKLAVRALMWSTNSGTPRSWVVTRATLGSRCCWMHLASWSFILYSCWSACSDDLWSLLPLVSQQCCGHVPVNGYTESGLPRRAGRRGQSWRSAIWWRQPERGSLERSSVKKSHLVRATK